MFLQFPLSITFFTLFIIHHSSFIIYYLSASSISVPSAGAIANPRGASLPIAGCLSSQVLLPHPAANLRHVSGCLTAVFSSLPHIADR